MTPFPADVVVVGAGFAGLSAAAVLAEAGRRVLVLDARPQLGGRATAFTDRATGELVDNGQHVLFGCYHETFEFLRRVGADAQHPPAAGDDRAVPRPAGPAVRAALPAAAAAAAPASPACCAGARCRWRDRLSVLRMAGPLLAARTAIAARPAGGAGAGCGHGLAVAGAGRAGRVASASGCGIRWRWRRSTSRRTRRRRGRSYACWRTLFGPRAADSALALPVLPLHRGLRAAGASVHRGAGRRRANRSAGPAVPSGPRRRAGIRVDVRGEPAATAPVIAAVPWFALGRAVRGWTHPALALDRRARVGDGREVDRHREPVVRHASVMDDAVRRLARARHAVGLRQVARSCAARTVAARRGRASHLSLVSSGADAIAGDGRHGADCQRGERDRGGAAASTRRPALRHATVIREKRATFSLAPGQPARPGTRTPVPGLYLAGDWIDDRAAGHDRERGGQRPPGGQRGSTRWILTVREVRTFDRCGFYGADVLRLVGRFAASREHGEPTNPGTRTPSNH